MPSITSWTRLEPRARSGDLRPALEARIHDPLWLLARQWQFGEYLGDDAGSPIWVRVRGQSDALTAYRPGPLPATGAPGAAREAYDAGTPLEALAEREAAPATDLRAAAESGQHLVRLLGAAGQGAASAAVLRAWPLPGPDAPGASPVTPAVRRFLTVMGGRAPHGHTAADALRTALDSGTVPAALGLTPPQVQAAVPVLRIWLAWHDARFTAAPAEREAWQADRLEYRFSVGADVGGPLEHPNRPGTEVTLDAPGYPGGRLDWADFSAGGPSGLSPTPRRTELTTTVFPAPAAFPGMPARRYWEFEDARVTLGGVDSAPDDLARMLLAEFATVYSNDWYVVPLEIPAGTLTTLSSVVVGDTFSSVLGGPTLMPPPGGGAGDAHWSMFTLSRPGGGRHPAFLLPPATAAGLEGEPLEEVLFARDEDANQAWAIERTVTDPAGSPLDRTRVTAPAPSPVSFAKGTLGYRLATEVPEHWIPLLPVEIRPGAVRLRRGHLTRRRPDGGREPVLPLGRLLTPGRPLDIREEEVPREGAAVTRTWQYARGADGRARLWVGRRKRTGRGESSSGLRFDSLVEGTDPGPSPTG
ncbi:hypothetical protein [Streptomyces sp. NPDC006638]|uniref:hypothetical protein n=1 Tax=Streptomyces sp. NPDC006638 TaxID=3157183 RepID=UPI0033BDC342